MTSTSLTDAELYFFILMWTLAAFFLNWVPLAQLFANNEYMAEFFGFTEWKVGTDIIIPDVWIAPGGFVYFVLHAVWCVLMSLAYFYVRRGGDWDDTVASNILFYVLMLLVAVWPWVGFPLQTVGLGVACLMAAIGVSIGATVMFWLAGPWWAGLLALFATIVLLIIFTQVVMLRRVWLRKFVARVRSGLGMKSEGRVRAAPMMRQTAQ